MNKYMLFFSAFVIHMMAIGADSRKCFYISTDQVEPLLLEKHLNEGVCTEFFPSIMSTYLYPNNNLLITAGNNVYIYDTNTRESKKFTHNNLVSVAHLNNNKLATIDFSHACINLWDVNNPSECTQFRFDPGIISKPLDVRINHNGFAFITENGILGLYDFSTKQTQINRINGHPFPGIRFCDSAIVSMCRNKVLCWDGKDINQYRHFSVPDFVRYAHITENKLVIASGKTVSVYDLHTHQRLGNIALQKEYSTVFWTQFYGEEFFISDEGELYIINPKKDEIFKEKLTNDKKLFNAHESIFGEELIINAKFYKDVLIAISNNKSVYLCDMETKKLLQKFVFKDHIINALFDNGKLFIVEGNNIHQYKAAI